MQRQIVIAALLLGLPAQAHAQAAGDVLCKIPKSEIVRSTECVRWHFVCSMPPYTKIGAPSGSAKNLSYQARMRLLADIAFSEAEKSCGHFDYQEAGAALEATKRRYAD